MIATNQLVRPTLPLGAFRQWLKSLDSRRMALYEETRTHRYLVIGSLFRLVQRKDSGKTWGERIRLTSLAGDYRWVKTAYLPVLHVFTLGNQWNNVRSTSRVMVEWLLRDLQVLEVTSLTTISAGEIDLSSPEGRSRVTDALDIKARLFAQHYPGSVIAGSQYLAAHLWRFINRRDLSLLMKIHQKPAGKIKLSEYLTFSNGSFDRALLEGQPAWLPWLARVPVKKFSSLQCINRETLTPWLGGLTKKQLRLINRQPRRLQAWLIKHSDSDYVLRVMNGVLNALEGYPSSVIETVLSQMFSVHNTSFEYCYIPTQVEDNKLIREHLQIARTWATYCRAMVGKVKIRKQAQQWERVLSQFRCVLDWHQSQWQVGVLHKNQHWASLFNQHERWIERINQQAIDNQQAADELLQQQLASTWPSAPIAPDFLTRFPDITIEEITYGKRLQCEGAEMQHCVWSYVDYCINQTYRVFSIKQGEDNYTLGLELNPVTLECDFDQLHGPRNTLAPATIKKIANQLIKHINTQSALRESHEYLK